MMTHEKTPVHPCPKNPKWVKKRLIGALIGGVAGYAAAAAGLHFIESSAIGGLGKSATVASLVGILYALIGFGVAFGAARPKVGARFLNVEDADELREQQKVLTTSGTAMVLWGAALISLALAAPDGPLPQVAALMLGAGGLVIGSVISIPAYRLSDELMRAVNLEGGALSFGLTVLIAGGWAMIAHLGFVALFAPLDLLTLFYVLMLAGGFIAVGRRGMLKPR